MYFDDTDPGNLVKNFTLDLNRSSYAFTPSTEGNFEHLTNHFLSYDGVAIVPPGTLAPAEWHRLLDFVDVPSRFVGTDTLLNTRDFHADDPNDPSDTTEPFPGDYYPYYAPFNRVSRFRDPGRVNINTIFDHRVWDALLYGMDETTNSAILSQLWQRYPTWPEILQSRKGYGDAVDIVQLDPVGTYPTFFANPFRSSSSSDFVPIPELKRVLPDTSADRFEVDVSLLRRDPTPPGAIDRPLMEICIESALHRYSPQPLLPLSGLYEAW